MTVLRPIWQSCIRPVLLTYAGIFFSSNPLTGALMLAATFSSFSLGMAGLAGTVTALAASRWLGFDKTAIDDGRLLFNSMLCSLGLAYWLELAPASPSAILILLLVIPAAALAVTVTLNQLCLQMTGLAARSLPFCLVAIILHWLLLGLRPEFTAPVPYADPIISPWADLWCKSLGAILFNGSIWGGLLLTLALLLASRISLLHALAGFLTSLCIQEGLEYAPVSSVWLHLNAMLCAMAIGGIFYIPSWSSFAVSAAASAICVCLGIALQHGLGLVNAPALTLPFNLTLLAVNIALRWREPGRNPIPAWFPADTPENTFRQANLTEQRLTDPALPSVLPPFEGVWVVTQGFRGGITHREKWEYALDFEVADQDRKPARPQGGRASDYPTFESPVLCPAAGKVVRVVNDVRDNGIGENNLAENWGNSVVIELQAGLYLQLSHFRCRSIKVKEGDRVRPGQTLGLVGNSGRSPLPHLHMQMQAQPEIGSSTLPFRLHSYRSISGSESRFHFRGLPEEGQAIGGQTRSVWMEECFRLPEPVTRTYRIYSGQGEWSETLTMETEAAGTLKIRSSFGGEVRWSIQDGILVPLTFSGPARSILAAFYRLGRLPLHAAPGMNWQDVLDEPCRPFPMRWLRDLAAPYLRRKLPLIEGRILELSPGEKKFSAEWNLHVPGEDMIQFHFDQGGLAGGKYESGKGWLRFHRDTQPEVSRKGHATAMGGGLLKRLSPT